MYYRVQCDDLDDDLETSHSSTKLSRRLCVRRTGKELSSEFSSNCGIIGARIRSGALRLGNFDIHNFIFNFCLGASQVASEIALPGLVVQF